MRVIGVDPATEVARRATETGIKTIEGYFTPDIARKIKNEHGLASIITANNVIANVDDLKLFTEGIKELLAPDGVFIFETSYLLDVIDKMLVETIFHEHLSYFSAKPLALFFQTMGLQLIDVFRVPTKGGSLRGVVQLADGVRMQSAAVQELINLETKTGLFTPEIFISYSRRLDKIKNHLQFLLSDLKGRCKTIAGYGASVGVTTLLYLFELNRFLDFIVDDNPKKQNLFSPGHHIPVLAPEVLDGRKHDYILILAWAYAEPIIKKHTNFQNQGGKYIIPLPEVKLI